MTATANEEDEGTELLKNSKKQRKAKSAATKQTKIITEGEILGKYLSSLGEDGDFSGGEIDVSTSTSLASKKSAVSVLI